MKQDSASRRRQGTDDKADPDEANGRVIELPITSGMGRPPLYEVPLEDQTFSEPESGPVILSSPMPEPPHTSDPVVLCSPGDLNVR